MDTKKRAGKSPAMNIIPISPPSGGQPKAGEDKQKALTNNKDTDEAPKAASAPDTISKTALMVLVLLAVQNCTKNLLMRYVMRDQPKFLTSAAVLGSEFTKLTASFLYILFVQRRPVRSIFTYLKQDMRNTLLLAVPASAYNLQMSLEYIALANLSAANFSVLVQTKLVFTASFAATVLGKKLRYIQVISLVLLTSGVMLCNYKGNTAVSDSENNNTGVLATLGIALSSGFASVYTEKVIKGTGNTRTVNMDDYGLAYTQVQLALMSLLAIGVYALALDLNTIVEYGLFHNFSPAAVASVLMSAFGGIVVASVLKYADSVLKGYATAMSVILTGLLSMVLFGTSLSLVYFLGVGNVVLAVLLYNGKNLDRFLC